MFPSTNAKNISVKCIGKIQSSPNKGMEKATAKDMEAQWNGMLRRYDANGDGRLSKKELKAAFKSAGSSMPGWRAFRALCHADKNGDGSIEKAELPGVLDYAKKRGFVL